MIKDKAFITVDDTNPANIKINFSGQLSFHSTPSTWQSCMKLQKHYAPEILTVDVQNVDYCDGAGIGLLLELKKKQVMLGKQFNIQGLSPKLQKLMALIVEQQYKPEEHEPLPYSVTVTIGRVAVNVLRNLYDNIIFIGMLIQQLWQTLLHPGRIRWRDFLKIAEDVAPNALPLIVLIGFLVGLITAFQSAIPLGEFGAQIYIADLVGVGLMREMGPLMTAVLLAGRTASAFAAELGSMKINQEVDALTTMGLDPVRFLIVPRILAVTVVTPFLSLFLIFFGLVGCGVVMQGLGFSFNMYTHELYTAIDFGDFMGGLVKTFVFGIVISAIGCLHGLKTRFGASAVGYSTTQAVVSSIIMIVIIDGVFAWIYYVLGV
ncbi:MAG: hypothetical protein AMJ43_04615 [Coxiella sp. DG_40]|nr:MAG: hypothetical protein AMJ43_04615 [Coxiella sp. DG_40]